MDSKGKERGILKLEPRPRVVIDPSKSELTPQGSYDHPPCSPQPSVDRLSVTWADPGSMTSSGVNLFHLPSETPISNEVKFSPSAGDGSEEEDYSASLSAVLRQRRASVRRSRKGRSRRPSSPFLPDESRARRRSSVFTTSSGDTAISIEETQPAVVTQDQIFENIHLHKEVLGSVKQQPLGMRRKLKIVHQAKGYIKRHEGQLQERLAQSKSTRDIYARFNILLATKWQHLKREAANTSNLLIPWELRIKEIESHFGSVVASYFTFLRWLFWVNLVIGFILLVFVIVPEYLTADPQQDGERKVIMDDEKRNATNLLTLWEFEGVLKCSPIFYGYYTNVERPEYRMPLAYFLTGLVVYIYSFVAILRKMAENSRMSKLSEKEDECIFSWKLFTGWDFMIGNTETAQNRIASVILGFKEALLEEAEKKKDLRNWRIISLRAIVNICVVILLAASAYAVVTVVSHSENDSKSGSWWRENETTIVVTVISITFPVLFEMLGFLEHYHPRKQLRLQLARIMLLNLLNLYSLIFALLNKIHGMTNELDFLKPELSMNVRVPNVLYNITNITDNIEKVPIICFEEEIFCGPCEIHITFPVSHNDMFEDLDYITTFTNKKHDLVAENLLDQSILEVFMKHRKIIENTKENAMFENETSVYNEKYDNTINTDDVNYTDYFSYTDEANSIDDLQSSFITNHTETGLEENINGLREVNNEDSSTTEINISDYIGSSKDEVYNTSIESSSYYININNLSTGENTISSDIETIENASTYDILISEYSTSSDADTNKIITYTYGTSTEINVNRYDDFNNESVERGISNFSTFLPDDSVDITKVESIPNDLYNNTIIYSTDFYSDNTSLENEKHTTLLDHNEYSSTNFEVNESETDALSSVPTYYHETENFSGSTNNILTDFTTTFNNEETQKIVIKYNNTNMSHVETTTEKFPKTNGPTLTTDIKMITNTNISDKTKVSTDLKTNSNCNNTITIEKRCPNISFNCTLNCGTRNITQVFFVTNCTVIQKTCYRLRCGRKIKRNGTEDGFFYIDEEPKCTESEAQNKKKHDNNKMDIAYKDKHDRTMYNLSIPTKKKLSKLCWETMFGQELVKLTMMDLVFVLLGTLFMDFFRAIFVRYMNRCCCWDLEKKFPEYGDFKIAENILHLINNQGMVWMGMFFSPGLVILNVVKLMIMMYLRSWAVMTCNVPHEVVFRVSKSNNFYLALLLTMLFLCVLPVGYTIVRVTPSWHCGPFSEYDRIYYIVTTNIYKILPPGLYSVLEYIASPAIVIPLLVLLILIIYYLTSLTNSLREANNDLKIQLRRERTEERRKMFQLADTRRRAGSSAMDNTPFARWKKALPSLPLSKSIDSDDRKTTTAEEAAEPLKAVKKRGGIFAKIVGLAIDKKTDVDAVSELDGASALSNNIDDETDTDFHESLPKEVLKAKDITMAKHDPKKKNSVEFKVNKKKDEKSLRIKLEKLEDNIEKKANTEKQVLASGSSDEKYKSSFSEDNEVLKETAYKKKQTSQSSTQSKQSDSIGSVIPVITISTTESDEEMLSKKNMKKENNEKQKPRSSDLKSLRRQSSVDSINEQKSPKEKKAEEGPKYQYSL